MLTFRQIAEYTGVPASTITYWHDRGWLVDSAEMKDIVKSIIAHLRKQIEENLKSH